MGVREQLQGLQSNNCSATCSLLATAQTTNQAGSIKHASSQLAQIDPWTTCASWCQQALPARTGLALLGTACWCTTGLT